MRRLAASTLDPGEPGREFVAEPRAELRRRGVADPRRPVVIRGRIETAEEAPAAASAAGAGA